jgi:hypothetical protein
VSSSPRSRAILNMHASNNRTSKYKGQKNDRNARRVRQIHFTVEYFNILLSVADKSSRQKISNDFIDLISTTHQLGLIDIYRIFSPTKQNGWVCFPNLHGTLTKRNYILHLKHTLTHLN